MKTAARAILLIFAVIAVAGILILWKKQDRASALATLRESWEAEITVAEDGFHVGCSSAKLVDLEEFARLLRRVGEPTILDLTGAPNLESFAGAERLPSLNSVMAIDCPRLVSARGLAGLPRLDEIVLTDSARFSDASALRDLPALSTLDLSGVLALEELDLSGLPALKNLYLSRCRKLRGIDLAPVPRLEQLYLDGCAELAGLNGLEQLASLTDLDLSNCVSLERVEGVGRLESLVVLDLRNVNLADFREVGDLPALRVLRLGGQDELENLEPFAGLGTLREIHVEACPRFRSLEGLPPGLTQYAGFTHCPSLSSLAGLEKAPGLEQLDLTGCTGLGDIGALASLENLVQLNLSKCRGVDDISPVADLEKLAIVLLGGSGVVPGSVKDLQQERKETIFDFSVAE